MTMPKASSLFLATLLLTGCYSFQAVERDRSPRPGSSVRVSVSPPSDADLFSVRGGDVAEEGRQSLRGDLLSWTADTLTVVRVSPGVMAQFDTLAIPTRFVSSVETMELDGTKTALLIVGGGALTGAIIASGFSSAGGSPPGGGNGPDVGGFRVPLLRFVLPR